MELDNTTGLPALLFRTALDDTRLAAAVIARVTYDLAGDRLVRSEEQSWGVSAAPWEGPAGPMPGDEVFTRGGVDLFVFGDACAPGARPTPSLQVRVSVGDRFRAAIAVFGDRFWGGRPGALKMSAPRPFVSMPLTLAHAYGGQGDWDGLRVTCSSNPAGKGFCVDEAQAPGTPLPNLEDPGRLLRGWDDAPDPVGTAVCPRWFGGRVRAGTTFDDDGRLISLRGRYFNDAFPGLIAPSVQPGDVLSVEGVTPEGPLRFVLPPAPLMMDVTIGNTRVEEPLVVDQVGIEPARRRVFITYRRPFRYAVQARQVRACALRSAPGQG